MLKSLVCVGVLGVFCKTVFSGPDLCENGLRIDAIEYIKDEDMWFFTSGGHYWYLKQSEFPPKVLGTPLPGGFKKGEAAIYKNFKDNCGKDNHVNRKQEIHLIELLNNINQVLIYDVKRGTWLNNGQAQPLANDKALSKANIDMKEPIEAMFVHKKTKVVVIQKQKYSIVDISGQCISDETFGNASQPRPTTDIEVRSIVDSTTSMGDDINFRLFQNSSYYFRMSVTNFNDSNGELRATKIGGIKDIDKDFFRFGNGCESPDKIQITTKVEKSSTQTESTTERSSVLPKETRKESGFPLLIVGLIVVVIIIVFIIGIFLFVCLIRRDKNTKKDNKLIDSFTLDHSKSTIKVSSKTVTQDKNEVNPNSDLGSTSKISVRSNLNSMPLKDKNKSLPKK